MNKLLWKPNDILKQQSQMYQFAATLYQKSAQDMSDYYRLWQWSVDNREKFWSLLCDFFEVRFGVRGREVLDDSDGMFMARWFNDSQLNFAENLLRYRDEKVAIEFHNENHQPQQLSYTDLYKQVSQLSSALHKQGVGVGDRVAAVVPNIPQAIIAMLACTSLGAIWSSCSPDFGEQSLLDRFKQINPKIVIFADGYFYKGKTYSSRGKIQALLKQLESVEFAIAISYINDQTWWQDNNPTIYAWDDIFAQANESENPQFAQLPFNHPLYILYSSGTTGIPKCIVHGAGGTLLQHLKELGLHIDLKRSDKIFYYTSTGWMMWNWLVSGLALGATIVLYDGCPTYPKIDSLLKLIQDNHISVFGCSAKYIAALNNAGVKCIDSMNLSSLRCILSTGSPLSADLFDYIYGKIKSNVQLSSISGGTDLISCFALGNPLSPVYQGELQGPGLGMAVDVFSPEGESIQEQKGELVCTKAFPSMPIYFWNDKDNQKYHSAYFSHYPDIWTHGDFAQMTKQQGLIIFGRSDTTLNPGGIRIGTAEIYRQIEQFPDITDSLVVGQQWQDDQRIILFVQMHPKRQLDPVLKQEICQRIRNNTSTHHVPAKILAVADIPRTYNGKLAEKAVFQTIHKQPVKNRSALINPEALDYFVNMQELISG